MHIAFLTPEYPHEKVLHAAGIGTSIKNLALALAAKGVRVSVFVYGQKETMEFEEDGVAVYLIAHKKYPVFTWFFYRKYLQKYLNQLVVREQVDLIEAPDWTGITAFMSLKAPLIIRLHGSDAYFCHLEKRKQKWKNFWFEKLALKKAKAIVAPTQFAGKVSKEIFKLAQTINVIPNGVNPAHFSNDFPTEYHPGTILYVGTLIRKKGVLEIPDIFKRVVALFPEAKLVLIGADSFDIKTQTQSTWQLFQQKLDKNLLQKVHYVGKLPYSEIKKHLIDAHVCIFPSFAETQGMVTIEAMSMQKAVVNSNIGWANELIVEGKSGFLVHPKRHQDYAEAIIKLLQKPKLTQEIGLAARERVEALFAIEKIAEQNIIFYQSQL